MFTGLVEEIGEVVQLKAMGEGALLTIKATTVLEDIKIGDSIAIDGACQTVTRFSEKQFSVFVSKVTLEITTLGSFSMGRKVNLERALMAGGRLGGHIVQGHVDGKGVVEKINKDKHGVEYFISTTSDLFPYIISKGSIAVDGISLTVVSATEKSFSLYIIPETIKKTTMENYTVGCEINLETDIIAKYVENMLKAQKNKEHSDDQLKRVLLEEGYI